MEHGGRFGKAKSHRLTLFNVPSVLIRTSEKSATKARQKNPKRKKMVGWIGSMNYEDILFKFDSQVIFLFPLCLFSSFANVNKG